MSSTRKDRPLGLFEKYQISKQITKAYGNVVLAAQLEHVSRTDQSTFYKDAFRPALTRLIQKHTSLSSIVRDADNSNAHFEQLTTIDIASLVHTVLDTFNLQELIRQESSNEFDTGSDLPLWRLTVMPTSSTTCAVAFAAHHVICDGMSLSIFWQDFLKELNSGDETTTSTDDLVTVIESKMADPYESCNPPDISVIRDVVPVVLKSLAPKILPTFMVNYLDPLKNNAWQGDHAAVEGEAHNTLVRLIHVSEDIWKPLLAEAKSRKLSGHAVLYTAVISAWAQLYPNQTTEVGTPTNTRAMCNPPLSNDQMGNFVGNHTAVWTGKQIESTDFWSLAATYGDDLRNNKIAAAKQSLFLKFLSDYPAAYCDFWYEKRRNSKLGRAGGIEVSDIGRFNTDGGDKWKLQGLYFCQSAQVFTSVFHVNSISWNDNLYCTVSWQNGALEESKMNQFQDIFVQILKQVPLQK